MIKPCKFCGAEGKALRHISDRLVIRVLCDECGAQGPPADNAKGATRGWNKDAAWKSLETLTGRDLLRLVRNGCSRTCSYDEAEGGIIDHCASCRTQITQLAYQLWG